MYIKVTPPTREVRVNVLPHCHLVHIYGKNRVGHLVPPRFAGQKWQHQLIAADMTGDVIAGGADCGASGGLRRCGAAT